MKFEKLNENKIRITLNTQDLIEKNIDSHVFMSDSAESQSLFMDMLEEAEKKVGFVTKDYKLRIEALAMSDGNFVFTITRLGKNVDPVNINRNSNGKKLKIKRKNLDMKSKQLIYNFNTFDDFCNFSNFISRLDNFFGIAKSMVLYSYKGTYYLCISNINTEHECIRQLYTLITEFATYVDNSEVFSRKLLECGKLVIKNNAIKICTKYFHSVKSR